MPSAEDMRLWCVLLVGEISHLWKAWGMKASCHERRPAVNQVSIVQALHRSMVLCNFWYGQIEQPPGHKERSLPFGLVARAAARTLMLQLLGRRSIPKLQDGWFRR